MATSDRTSSRPATRSSPRGQPWILVVDDEPAIQNMLRAILEEEGWRVEVAGGAKAASALIDSAALPPDVMVCDVLMPGMDGFEFSRRMLVRLPELRIIFISGHVLDVSWWPEDLREHQFLTKPFDNEALVAAVKDARRDDGKRT